MVNFEVMWPLSWYQMLLGFDQFAFSSTIVFPKIYSTCSIFECCNSLTFFIIIPQIGWYLQLYLQLQTMVSSFTSLMVNTISDLFACKIGIYNACVVYYI